MRIRLAAFALAATVAVAGCTGDKTAGDGGGTVIAAFTADMQTMFPLLAADEASKAITDVLFEKLAKIDDSLSVFGDRGFKPRLAKSWDWAADSLSITFHLDPAARFHDGTPVTAKDLQYTFRVAKDTLLGGSVTSLIATIDSVTVVDSLTARVWYNRRSPTQFYDAVYQLMPLPEHVYGKVPVGELRTSSVTRTPVGTGRFRFVKWEPEVRVEVVADTANFMGRPKLDRVIFNLKQAPPAAIAAVQAGQIDFISAFPMDQLPALDSGTVARSIPFRQNGYAYLGMNSYARKTTARSHPVLGDIAVRRAIAMALDRQGMLTNVFGASSRLAYGPFPTGAVLSDTTLRTPAYDTTAAKAALDAAGWRVGPNGVRMKNGRPLEIEILVPVSSYPRVRYAELIQEQLNRVGFRTELARATTQFYPRLFAGDFDLTLMTVNTDPTPAGVQQFWASASPREGGNFLRYQSRTVDALLDSAGRATTPEQMRRQVNAAFQRIMDDVPAVWLYSAATMAALHRRVEPAPFPLDGWWGNLAEWSIPADKRIDRDRIGLRPAATP